MEHKAHQECQDQRVQKAALAEWVEEDLGATEVIRVLRVLLERQELQEPEDQEEPKAPLEHPANLERLVFKEATAYLELRDPLVLQVQRDFRGQWEQEVLLAPLEDKVKPDRMENQDQWESLVLRVERAHRDRKDLWAIKVPEAWMVPKELKEDRVVEEEKEAKERLEVMERKAHQATRAEVEEMARLDHVAWTGRPVILEYLEYKVHVEKQAHKASLE